MAGLVRAIVLLQYKPLIAEAHGKKDNKLLQEHVTFMVKVFVLTGIPITLGLWFFSEQAMRVFGSEFVAGAWAMRIYVAGVFITLAFGPSNAILMMTGHEHISSRLLMFSLLIQITLNAILIPFVGALGCALASFIALCFLAIVSRVMVIKKVGIEPSIIENILRFRK
jgi:O-antigen/teichoic acid export membrane protein